MVLYQLTMVMSKIFYRISNNRELSLLYPNNAIWNIKKLTKSSVTHTLLAEEQATEKSKYIKHS